MTDNVLYILQYRCVQARARVHILHGGSSGSISPATFSPASFSSMYHVGRPTVLQSNEGREHNAVQDVVVVRVHRNPGRRR